MAKVSVKSMSQEGRRKHLREIGRRGGDDLAGVINKIREIAGAEESRHLTAANRAAYG